MKVYGMAWWVLKEDHVEQNRQFGGMTDPPILSQADVQEWAC